MGGFVARAIVANPRYTQNDVVNIISWNSPHIIPPTPVDPRLTTLYEETNRYWKEKKPPVLSLSVNGGFRDTLVSHPKFWLVLSRLFL